MSDKNPIVKRKDLLYPELSYKIIGVLFEVYNSLGCGYKEIYYQRAIASVLKEGGLAFKEQVPAKIKFKDQIIGKVFLIF